MLHTFISHTHFWEHLEALWIRIFAWCLFHAHPGWYIYPRDRTSIYVLLVQLILWLKVTLWPGHPRADRVGQGGPDFHGYPGALVYHFLARETLLVFPPSTLLPAHRLEMPYRIHGHSLNGFLYHSQGLSLWHVELPDLVLRWSHCLSAHCWSWQRCFCGTCPRILSDLWGSCGN